MRSWILLTFVLSCCLAQQPAAPTFEVASIKPSKPMGMNQMRIRMGADAGMLRYNNVSLKDCVRTAYRLKEFQVQGPDWMESERFDIEAKLPDGASQDQIPEMLQALLAERFKLAVHRDTKEHAIYAMVVAKGGPKLKAADPQAGLPDLPGEKGPAGDKAIEKGGPIEKGPGSAPGRGFMPRGAMMMRMGPGGANLKAPNATLDNLAEIISRFTERPVVNMTEIKGQYDFDFSFMPEAMHGMPGGRRPMPPPGGEGMHASDAADPAAEKAGTIQEAVQRYGLKLEPRKAPMEILIVDHLEKVPTEN
jgi:uncharacterized protein (TIGR03435 family)